MIINIGFPYCVKLAYFNSEKNPRQILDIATNSAAKHQGLDESLKIKFKVLKEFEKYTPKKAVAPIFSVLENNLST